MAIGGIYCGGYISDTAFPNDFLSLTQIELQLKPKLDIHIQLKTLPNFEIW